MNTSFLPKTLCLALPLFLLFLGLTSPFGGSASAAEANEPPHLPQAKIVNPPPGSDMLAANTYAGDAIANMLLKRMGSGRSVLTASMVEMDKLDRSSAFGRLAMQQVGSRVSQYGFKVIDVHLTEAMIINNNGEFMLSRDICKILADRHDAYAVLVGTYAPSGSRLYVSVRALRLADAVVLAAYEYYLPLSGDTSYLLGGAGGSYGTGGDPAWSRYAARGQAFANCPPQRAASAPAPVASRPAPAAPVAAPAPVVSTPKPAVAPAKSTKSSKAKAGKKSGKKRRTASRGSGASRPAASSGPVAYTGAGEPICPQDVPSNRRIVPDDCNRGSSRAPVVYGEEYVDRGGGRVVNPNSPAPAVGRAY